jgi:hypothetical protein
MSTPPNPGHAKRSSAPPSAAPPWWAPHGSGSPPDSWSGQGTGHQHRTIAARANWPAAEPTAGTPPASAVPVRKRVARRVSGHRFGTRIGVALVAVVLLGGAGAAVAAATVDDRGGGPPAEGRKAFATS